MKYLEAKGIMSAFYSQMVQQNTHIHTHTQLLKGAWLSKCGEMLTFGESG